VEQLEKRDRAIKGIPSPTTTEHTSPALTSPTPISPNGSSSTRRLDNCSTTSSRSSSSGSLANKDLNDDEDKDENCVDPESMTSKKGLSGDEVGKHNSKGTTTAKNGLVHVAIDGRVVTNGLSKVAGASD